MAITKTLRLKESKSKNPALHLKNNLFYICNTEKTEDGKYVYSNTGLTEPGEILNHYLRNKDYWNKKDGTQGFHYMLSVPPGCNCSPELLMKVAQEFVEELLGGQYYFTVAVHTDRPHLHAHITFDAVSVVDGRKWHSPKGDWAIRLQPLTDRLCKKYNLPTLNYDPGHKKGITHGTWEKQKRGKLMEDGSNSMRYDWTDVIRDDLDEAISVTDTYKEFLSYLKERGYQIRSGKYLSLRPAGFGKAIRSYRLGEGYGKDAIIQRIRTERRKGEEKRYGDMIYVKRIICRYFVPGNRMPMTPFQRAFYKKWQNTYFIRKPYLKNAWKYKKDILRVHELAEQFGYVIDHELRTPESVERRTEQVQSSLKAAQSFYRSAQKYLRADPENLEIQNQQEKCKDDIKKIKYELKILERIKRTDLSTAKVDPEWLQNKRKEVSLQEEAAPETKPYQREENEGERRERTDKREMGERENKKGRN